MRVKVESLKSPQLIPASLMELRTPYYWSKQSPEIVYVRVDDNHVVCFYPSGTISVMHLSSTWHDETHGYVRCSDDTKITITFKE